MGRGGQVTVSQVQLLAVSTFLLNAAKPRWHFIPVEPPFGKKKCGVNIDCTKWKTIIPCVVYRYSLDHEKY